MGSDRKFKAFISYRHCPLDMAVAERLQELIERYQIPKEYRKDKEKRLGLVFRDVSELPLSSNLTDDIYTALDNSEFLIVVCTPDTPKSLWVAQEIGYFIKTHGRDRILAVLADGTPEESLPDLLTHIYDSEGKSVGVIEPLCANLVDTDQKKVLKKLSLEFLRLVAAMLGVPYDALYQRRKRYLLQVAACGAGIAALIMAVFIAMLIRWNLDITRKNEEIAENLRLAQINESEALVLLSRQHLHSGDREAAVKSALDALPREAGERPYLAKAEGALAKALNPYGTGMLNYHLTITQSGSVGFMGLTKDGTRLVTLDSGDWLRCYETDRGTLLWEVRTDGDIVGFADSMIQILDGRDEALLRSNHAILAYSMEDGRLLRTLELTYAKETYTATADVIVSNSEEVITLKANPAKDTYRYSLYDMATFSCLEEITCGADAAYFYETVGEQQICAAYSDRNDRLTVTARRPDGAEAYRVRIDDVKPGAASMTMTDCRIYPRPDGSLVLVCQSNDTDYSKHRREYVSLYHVDARGNVLYRETFDRPKQFRHLVAGDYLVLISDNYTATLVYTTFGSSVTLRDMSSGFSSREYEFGSAGIYDCYIRPDGELVTVMNDGSVRTPMLVDGDLIEVALPNLDQMLRFACAAKTGEELVCMVPEKASNTVVMLRTARNRDAVPLADAGAVAVFPSGDRFLTVEYVDSGENEQTLVTVYDGETLRMLDQFYLTPATGYVSVLGFSADETEILYEVGGIGYAYDLQTHSYMPYGDGEGESGYAFVGQSLHSQIPGDALLTYGLDSNCVYWYRDTQYMGTYTYPLEDGEYIRFELSDWDVGGSGLIVEEIVSQEDSSTAGYFVYSTADETCRRVPNESSVAGRGKVGVGNTTKMVAFGDADGVLRLYDFARNQIIREMPLPVPVFEVSAIRFVNDDRNLLIFKENGGVTVLDVSGREAAKELFPDGAMYADRNMVKSYPEKGILCLLTGFGYDMGYLVDMNTWDVLAEIPGFMGYLPQSDRIIQQDYFTQAVTVSPRYTCQALIDRAGDLLEPVA